MLRLSIVAGVISAVNLLGQAAPSPNLFRDTVQPILQKNCLACHNAKLKQGGLDLSTREALLKGSEHGPVVVAGKPDDSQLYKLVAHISE
ncbi:MAG TPA: c-type cytochrome domain-containing protein, partial [Bryobacteraceae bacterium]|nr:c-type cytochrome domain-containing protein [Bryobacteraceae bacterium]